MLLLHFFSLLTLTPQDACPTSSPSSLLADDLASHNAGKIEKKKIAIREKSHELSLV